MSLKRFLKDRLPDKTYNLLRHSWHVVSADLGIMSIRSALAEQRLSGLYSRLTDIVPDITHQYTSVKIDTRYLRVKVRAQHSFQINLVNKAIEMLDDERRNKILKVVDIGDSAGTHLQYIKGLWPERNIRTLSVNSDENAVKKIKAEGLEAVCSRAEDITTYSADEDILLSFEMLEHLMNPFQFMHSLSKNTNCAYFVVTVPYVRRSRLGLHHMRSGEKKEFGAENTHILELSPEDWRLLFKFSGWCVKYERVYLQYPRPDPFGIMKFFWRRFDFEGFYGVILTKDATWRDLYKDWEV